MEEQTGKVGEVRNMEHNAPDDSRTGEKYRESLKYSFLYRLAFTKTSTSELKQTHFSSTAEGGDSYTVVWYVQSTE